MGERWILNEAKAALESIGMQVFSPLHDVGIGEADKVVPADTAATPAASPAGRACG